MKKDAVIFVINELRYLADQIENGTLRLTSVVLSTPAINSPTPARLVLEITPTTVAIEQTT